MIPVHNSDIVGKSKITINKLSKLNDYDFTEPHRHNYFELFYFEQGGGSHIIDFEDLTISSKSIHIVAPGQVHQMGRALDSSGFVFLFGLESVRQAGEIEHFLTDQICRVADQQASTYQLSQDEGTLINQVIEESWKSNQEDDKYNQYILRNALERLCIQCMKRVEHKETYKLSEYGTFRRLLIENFKEKRKVQDYVDEMNMSAKSLNDLVKRHSGKSVSNVIYDQIILEAKRLLLIGQSTKQVGYDLNFDDPAHFSKFFKAQTDLSPSEFQKIHS
ncbi:MAG: AraC family transcriptional activator of pobA [Crocinitomicaceae bacterium]|jgi:AraC family transcriptional activator of pobA